MEFSPPVPNPLCCEAQEAVPVPLQTGVRYKQRRGASANRPQQQHTRTRVEIGLSGAGPPAGLRVREEGVARGSCRMRLTA